jgi:hypothetical protein
MWIDTSAGAVYGYCSTRGMIKSNTVRVNHEAAILGSVLRLLLWAGLVSGAVWLSRRLWPAIRTEPATWLGEDWQEEAKRRLAGTARRPGDSRPGTG